jgi:SAM-dependent methyltransferase
MRVLDVATGPGVVARAARRRGAEVVAVDQAEAMVRLATEAGLDARRATAEHLPFDDASFDAVVAGFLLNHLARPEEGMGELARVCRGRVAVSVWDGPSANPALGLFGPVVRAVGAPDVVPPGPAADRYADDDLLAALLRGVGLDDVRIVRVGWAITVEPGAWFDSVAAATPRTGSVLASSGDELRAAMRERYVEVARAAYGTADGAVSLPAAAVVGSGAVRCGGMG